MGLCSRRWYPLVMHWLCSALLVGFCLSCSHPPRVQNGGSGTTPPADDAQAASDERQPEQPDPKSFEIDLASVVWAPFTNVEGEEHVATDLVETALSRAGVKMRAHITEPGDVTRSIEAGKFDGSEALWKSDERQAYLLYSKPYLENRLVLLGRKGTDVSATRLSDLSGKKVGLVEGYAYGSGIDEADGVEFVRIMSDEANFRALLNREVDYILVDDLLVYHLFEYQENKAKELLNAGTHPLILRGLHLALRKDVPDAREIIDRFNGQISNMIRNGEYHRILNVHWILADADGDGTNELLATSASVGAAAPSHRYQLFGPRMEGAPRLMIEDEVYDDWESIPSEYKIPNQPVAEFRPLLNGVLAEF